MRKNRQTAKYHIKSYIIAGSLAGDSANGRWKREIYDEE